jgi:hypothetical protein
MGNLQTACKEFVAKTDKLIREYERYGIELEDDWQYDKLSELDWFIQKEYDKFYEHFVEPFLKEHPEYDEDDENVDEILREEMYNQDKYECIVL